MSFLQQTKSHDWNQSVCSFLGQWHTKGSINFNVLPARKNLLVIKCVPCLLICFTFNKCSLQDWFPTVYWVKYVFPAGSSMRWRTSNPYGAPAWKSCPLREKEGEPASPLAGLLRSICPARERSHAPFRAPGLFALVAAEYGTAPRRSWTL